MEGADASSSSRSSASSPCSSSSGRLGLRALGQSDAQRREASGRSSCSTSAYRDLADCPRRSAQLRQLRALRAGGDIAVLHRPRQISIGADTTIAWTCRSTRRSPTALSRLGPATDESRFGFTPSANDEKHILTTIRTDHRQVWRPSCDRIIVVRRGRSSARRADSSSIAAAEPLTNKLALRSRSALERDACRGDRTHRAEPQLRTRAPGAPSSSRSERKRRYSLCCSATSSRARRRHRSS